MNFARRATARWLAVLVAGSCLGESRGLTGQGHTGDWQSDAPGVEHKITIEDLPPDYATPSAYNRPKVVARPKDAGLNVPDGFTVTLFASGSEPEERDRARIFEFGPDGSNRKVYAWGLRNAVGIAVHPETGDLWASVNERDGLGDDLVPDYITRVREGGFYGWPWFYLGKHQDPRHPGARPDLVDKVLLPDVLVQAHSAPLQIIFYQGAQFPDDYRGDAFVALHGSWNRAKRTGYEVVRVPLDDGRARGVYEDFLTGFVTSEGDVWGRPVGLAVMKDGSLLVSEDANDSIWRVAYGE